MLPTIIDEIFVKKLIEIALGRSDFILSKDKDYQVSFVDSQVDLFLLDNFARALDAKERDMVMINDQIFIRFEHNKIPQLISYAIELYLIAQNSTSKALTLKAVEPIFSSFSSRNRSTIKLEESSTPSFSYDDAGLVKITLNGELLEFFKRDLCKAPIGENAQGIAAYKTLETGIIFADSDLKILIDLLGDKINHRKILLINKSPYLLVDIEAMPLDMPSLHCLLEIILETKEIKLTKTSDDRVEIEVANSRFSKKKGQAHAFAIQDLSRLFQDIFRPKLTTEFLVLEVDKHLALERLTTVAIARYLVSLQNYLYYKAHQTFHPVSGSGATYSSNLRKSFSDLVSNCRVEIGRDSAGLLKFIITDEALLSGFVADFAKPPFGANKDGIEITCRDEKSLSFAPGQMTFLLEQMAAKKTNYHGIIPLTSDGKILMAQHKDSGSKAYATCGGHFSDPYHLVALAADLKDEFDLTLSPSCNIDEDFILLERIEDFAIYAIDDRFFNIANFVPNKKEFLPKSGEAFSFKEMRQRKLGLRNIDSLEYYLRHCSRQLNQILSTKIPPEIFNEVFLNEETNFDEKTGLKIVGDNFGILEFKANPDKLSKLASYLDSALGVPFKINRENNSIIISNFNPKQIIDVLEGRKTKENLQEYLQEQQLLKRRDKAAHTIQKKLRPIINKTIIKKSASHVDIDRLSAQNLENLRKDLRSGKFLEEEKDAAEILTEAEKALFSTISQMPLFLFHCAYLTSPTSIYQLGILSYETLKQQDLFSPQHHDISGFDKKMGTSNQVFFSIGSQFNIPIFLSADRQVMVRIDLRKLLANQETLDRCWTSEDWFFFKDSSSYCDRVGNVEYRAQYASSFTKTYTATDRKKRIQETRELGEDISSAQDCAEFLHLMIIHKLRFIGGLARQYLLENPQDVAALSSFINSIFNHYNLEFHFLANLKLDEPFVDASVYTASQEIATSQEFLQLIETQNLEGMQDLSKRHPNLYYRCQIAERSKQENPNAQETLLTPYLEAALKTNNPRIIQFLIEQEFFASIATDYALSKASSAPMKELIAICKQCGISPEIKNLLEEFHIFDATIMQEHFPALSPTKTSLTTLVPSSQALKRE